MQTTTEYKSVFSFLWQIIKPYKYHYLMQGIAPIYTGFVDLIYFYCVKLFIDILIKPTFTYNELIYPLIIFFTIPIVLNIVWRIANILEWRSYPQVRQEILIRSCDYVQHHAYHFFQNNLSGSIVSKIKSMLEAYDKLFSPSIIKDTLMFGVMLASGLAAIFFISSSLASFVLVWVVIYFFIMFAMTKKLDFLVSLETESKHSIIGLITDQITNIVSLFYFASRRRELNFLKQQITDDFIPKQIRACKYDCLINLTIWSLHFTMWGFFVFTLIQTSKKEFVTAGTIAFTFGIISRIANAAWMLSMKLQELIRLVADFKTSFAILQIPHENTDKVNAKKILITQPSIEFKDVCFSYGNNQVFNEFNLSVRPGENVGIVGYSGAGKTTLVNILLKFFALQQGDIFIDGQNIQEVTADSLRANISVIPQDIMLFHRTLLENIKYGLPMASNEEVIAATKHAHIHDFITTLADKYNTSVGERGIKLSGGQRQRIAIARAILKNASILILDEATSSLDSRTERDIQDSINYLLARDNQTVIAIAHRLSTLRHMDRIVVIHKGTIVEEGTHDSLLQKQGSLYQRLWEEQMI